MPERTLGPTIISLACFILLACKEPKTDLHFETSEAPGGLSAIMVLTHTDYEAVTGCQAWHYGEAMKAALTYLVLSEPSQPGDSEIDISQMEERTYARRHTRLFFEALQEEHGQDGQDGLLIPSRCLPPSIRELGERMGVLQPASSEMIGTYSRYDAQEDSFPDDQSRAFEILSRQAYIDKTRCLVSPSSYAKFAETLFLFLNDKDSGALETSAALSVFFDDLKASRPTQNGGVDEICLTPGLRRMGTDLGLLEIK